ncbi:histone-lysine N-methyltransferase SETD5 isoform X3 [Paramormyrops kingsleyae]|uniref:histone-lysine N-methyltransferase SETD5 isoform X3 n=1 Tax=Paramormyrops kingsleyae TaxID=1676925 RepID=UPI003B96EABD
MSIAIALGVTTPETSYTDMAAGSDPESVEASPAVNEKYPNHSCGSAQSHGYRGLPYAARLAGRPHVTDCCSSHVVCCQDHNYGAPPPPTPPASPVSQTIIPRVEFNGVPCYADANEDDNSADSDSSSDEEPSVAGWCHCSLTQDGFLIKCDGCRGLDRRKGVDGQRQKAENVSAGESSATESGDEEVSPSTVSYTATQHTPTSITLTVNRVKRPKPKKRKKSTEKARGAPKPKKIKAFREGSRKSMRMKNSTMDTSTLDENTAEGWETRIRQWTDQYEEALANQYSADVQTLLQQHRAEGRAPAEAAMDNINRTELACNNTVIGSQMQLQLGRVTRVQKHRKILRAARDLETDTLIIEYRGKVMLKQQFEVNGHFFKKPYPFVLFYSKFNEVEMCVDARTFGNDARFIRRSCTPNAEVRHMIAEGMIHLCIYAVTRISKDSEVTIGFDYEFSSCNYKVDCACHKGNQNCPVQKHNLNPLEQPLRPPSLPPPETRRRKARRKELEAGVPGTGSDDSSQLPEEAVDSKDRQGGSTGASDAEEGLCDGLKPEGGQEAELDENGSSIQSRRTREERKAEAVTQVFDNLEKRRKRSSQTQERCHGAAVGPGAEEPKQEGGELGDGDSPLAGTPPTQSTGEVPPPEVEKTPAASKPAPVRSSKPRPKSRISRYRSGSSQRARRQRQALAQQASDPGPGVAEEGVAGASGVDLGVGEGVLMVGQPVDPEGPGGAATGTLGSKSGLRYHKTKKYLVTEWLNDKVPEKPESPLSRPLRITTDPTVLATTLNMLPGLSPSPLICTTPKHYVRFGSPFTPERRRRPVIVDGSYGSFKKRWIKQAQDESLSSARDEGETPSDSSHQSSCSSTAFRAELTAPFKKRKWKYGPQPSSPPSPLLPVSSEGLLRPLSPITPPPALPSDPLHTLLPEPCQLTVGAADERPNGYSRPYSPIQSPPTSRCNTPLQFENISSPEASPVHRPESLSPEPCLRKEMDGPCTMLSDPPLPSALDSPTPLEDCPHGASDPFGASGPAAPPVPADTVFSTRPVEVAMREQSFRKEFSLIYACSPLNSNLAEGLGVRTAGDRRPSQSEGSFSPAEPFFNCVGGQGVIAETGAGSLSPYPEPHYSGSYPDSGTPPHPGNPPQKKKKANLHTISLLTGKPDYQALSVRSEYKTVPNMVSLLEYRKRKQGAKEPDGAAGGAEPFSGPRSALQPPSSPQSCLSSPVHAAIPHMEEVSPPDHGTTSQPLGHQPRAQDSSSHWMVPTSVERLREGQGVLERVLRGGLKMEHALKRTEAPARPAEGCRDKEAGAGPWPGGTDCPQKSSPGRRPNVIEPRASSTIVDLHDTDNYDTQAASRDLVSPAKSPQRYSHGSAIYSHQVPSIVFESHQKTEPPSFLHQSASSPFRGSYSPSAPSPSQAYYSRLTSNPPLTQEPSLQQQVPASSAPCYPAQASSVTSSFDAVLCGSSRKTGGAPQHPHQLGGAGPSGIEGSQFHSGSPLKSNLLNSAPSGLVTTTPAGVPRSPSLSQTLPKTDASRLSQQPGIRTLSPDSPGQAVLPPGSRLLSASSSQHYTQRSTPVGQFQHRQISGSGVRTQSGSY